RLLRRAQLPMAHSQGFNPRPKIVFTLPLGLGIDGRREVVELDLAEPMEPDDVLDRLRAASPAGLDWFEAEGLAPGRPAQPDAVPSALVVPAEFRDAAQQRVASFLQCGEWLYTRHRPDRTASVDLRPFVLDAELDPLGTLRFRMKIQ